MGEERFLNVLAMAGKKLSTRCREQIVPSNTYKDPGPEQPYRK